MKKRSFYLLISLLTILSSCHEKKTKAKTKKVAKVEIAEVVTKTVPYYINTIGNTEAFSSVNIRPQVSGELTGYYFTDGDDVARGKLLFTIDKAPYQASLEEAEGQLLQAKSDLNFQIEKVNRYKELLPDDYVSKLDYDQYVSNKDTAEGKVVEYIGSVNKAKVNLYYCTIRAPIEGRLGKHQFDPGDIVMANQEKSLVTINCISPLYLTFTVAEKFLPLIQKYQKTASNGLEIQFNVCGEENKTYTAGLDFINNQVDKDTGTILLRGILQNEEKLLWPGQFVHLHLNLYNIPDAHLIPEKSIGQDVKGPFIYIAKDDGTVEKRNVTIGQRHGSDLVISKGVNSHEKVVTSGMNSLYPGAKYEVKK